MNHSRHAGSAVALIIVLLMASCGGTHPALEAGQTVQPQNMEQTDPAGTGGTTAGLFEVRMQPQQPLEDGLRGVSFIQPDELADSLADAFDSKSTLCAGSGWYIDGGAFQDGLPSSNVGRQGDEDTEGLYSPDYDGLALESGSYAIYRWNLRGYNGEKTVGFSWVADMAPANVDDWYIGFANLQDNRWDFYEGPDDNVLSISSFGPYRKANGDVLLAFVLLGNTDAALANMQAGVPEKRATGDLGLPETAPDFPLLAKASVLPAAVDLSGECAPVNDQMQWGACTAFAVGDSAYNHELGQVYGAYGWNLQSPANRVSPKYLYIKSGELGGFPASGDYGRYTDEVIDNLMNYGTATDANAPYDMVYDNNWSSAALEDAKVLKIESWREVPCNTDDGIDTVKRILAEQGKVLPMRVNLDITFPSLLPGQVWYYTWGTIGGHAMCIVGYDDSKGASGAFKVRNSWGRFWGDKGYCWIAYESFRNPYAFIRCYTMTEDYGVDVIDRFGLNAPSVPPVTGLFATQGGEQGGIGLNWDEHTAGGMIHVYRDTIDNEVAVLDGSATQWLDEDVSDPFGHVYWVQAEGSRISPAVTGYIAALPQVLEVLPLEGRTDEGLSIGASVTGSGPMSFVWDFGLGATPSSSIQQRPFITLKNPGTYGGTLTVSNAIGSDEFSFQYTVLPQPVVINYVYGNSGYSGDQAIVGVATDGPPQSYSWDFGGACTPDTSTDGEPFVTFGAPGIYEASVTIGSGPEADVFNFYMTVLDGSYDGWLSAGLEGRNSRSSPLDGPQDANLAWRFFGGIESNNPLTRLSAPLVLQNSDIVFSAQNDSAGCSLRCIGSDGSLNWQLVNTEFSYRGQPLASRQTGNIFCSFNNIMQCIDPADGSLIWQSDSELSNNISVIGETAQGVLYCIMDGKYIVGLDAADGSRLTDPVQVADKFNTPIRALLTDDGRLICTGRFGYDDLIFTLDSGSGTPTDNLRVPQAVTGMAISPDGLSLYTVDSNSNTRCIDLASCNELWWQKATRGQGGNAPAVMADGTVIVVNGAGLVNALNPATGEVLWDFGPHNPDEDAAIPVLGRDGTVYYGADQQVFAVHDGVEVWASTINPDAGMLSSPSLAGNGDLYISDSRGRLWAFGPGTGMDFIPAQVSAVDPLAAYANQEQSFSADVAGTAPLSYSWDFGDAAVPSVSTDPAPSVMLSDAGSYPCTLTLSNALGTDVFDFTLELTDAPSGPRWESYVLQGYGASQYTMDAALIDGKPAVALWEKQGDAAHYLYSDVADPQAVSDWQHEDISDAYRIYSLAEVGGEPVVASFIGSELKYIRRSGGTWTAHVVNNVAVNGGYADVALVNGKPAVVYARRLVDDYYPVYARSTELYPTSSSDWVFMDISDNNQSSGDRMQLEDLGGKPHLVFRSRYDAAWRVAYACATTVDPSLPGDWTWHTVDETGNGTGGFSLLMYDGLPMVACSGSGSPTELRIARASTASPTSSGDWSFHVIEAPSSIAVRSLIELDSRPAVGYSSYVGHSYATIGRSTVDEPSEGGDWSIERVLQDVDTYSMLNVNGNPAFIVVDANTKDLIYLHWIPS